MSSHKVHYHVPILIVFQEPLAFDLRWFAGILPQSAAPYHQRRPRLQFLIFWYIIYTTKCQSNGDKAPPFGVPLVTDHLTEDSTMRELISLLLSKTSIPRMRSSGVPSFVREPWIASNVTLLKAPKWKMNHSGYFLCNPQCRDALFQKICLSCRRVEQCIFQRLGVKYS